MTNIIAIFKKQFKDTLKNKIVLIQFIMFPVLAIIMNNTIQTNEMPSNNFFVTLFATMYIGMTPLTNMAAIISEEKEKNTLRVLMMSNVKPWEYLLGIGSYIWFICILSSIIFCIVGAYQGKEAIIFLAIMATGTLVSLLIGAVIGIWSKNQMMATSIAFPVMMVFSFLPMISMFNTTISKIAKFTYSEQISIMIGQVQNLHIEFTNVAIIAINIVITLVLFIIAYKKSGLA